MKYIDADKLIAILERQNVDKKVIQPLILIIDSLQAEENATAPFRKIHTYTEEIHEGDIEKMLLDISVGEGKKKTKIALPDRVVDYLRTEENGTPINLDKEIEEYWIATGWSKKITLGKFKVIARYFYGLGQLNSK